MKRILVITWAILSVALVWAQAPEEGKRPQRNERSIEDFFKMKVDFVVKDLKLEPADSAKFAPLYKEYQMAKGELMREAGKGRVIGRKLMKRETITDEDYLAATHGEIEYKYKEAELAKIWFAKFEEFLTPQQLFTLLRSEEHFAAEMMNRHGHRNFNGNPPGKQTK